MKWLKKSHTKYTAHVTTHEAKVLDHILQIESYSGVSGKIVCEWSIWTLDGMPIEWPGGVTYGLNNAKKKAAEMLEEYLTDEVKPVRKGIYGN